MNSNLPLAPKPLHETIARFETYRSKVNVLIPPLKPSCTLQLPLWPDDHRSIPNEIVRSALFNARNKKFPRLYLKKAEIFVIGKGKITYTGEELRQDDETVWLQLIHLAKDMPLGRPVEFTPYYFCKCIGWNTSGRDYVRLREILNRLQATSLEIYSGHLKEGLSLSMLPMFRWKDHASNASLKKYQVAIAPELLHLFGKNHFTQLEWKQRLSLPLGIATWLHGYFASHKDNFPIRIETIRQGCGIHTQDLKRLKQMISTALRQLEDSEFLIQGAIVGEKVLVRRSSKNE